MKTLFDQKTSLLLITIIEFLERFSFYGTRAIVILFAIDEEGLDLANEEALSYYGYLASLIFLLPLPVGIISDLTLKQKNGILLGGIIALAGYTSLITGDMTLIIIGMILMTVGTSFVKVNMVVLLGRLYEKTDKSRGFGFMIFYFVLNLGALFGILAIGNIGESAGWKYGFMLSAFVTLFYLVLFYFIKDQLPLIEKNIDQKYLEANDLNDPILDSELSQPKKPLNPAPIFLIIIITVITALFWTFYEASNVPFFNFLSQKEGFIVMGFDIPFTMIQTITSETTMVLMLVFIIIWYFQGIGSTIGKIASGMILLGISIQLMYYIINVPQGNFVNYTLLTLFIFSVAEVLIAPIAMSYITRLSDVQYSSTIYGFYIFGIGIATKGLNYFMDFYESSSHIIVFSIIAILIGFALLFFRKIILKMSGGLD